MNSRVLVAPQLTDRTQTPQDAWVNALTWPVIAASQGVPGSLWSWWGKAVAQKILQGGGHKGGP